MSRNGETRATRRVGLRRLGFTEDSTESSSFPRASLSAPKRVREMSRCDVVRFMRRDLPPVRHRAVRRNWTTCRYDFYRYAMHGD